MACNVSHEKESLKILEIHFSCNKKLETKFFESHTFKTENVFKLWKIIEGKITIFKTLTFSKINSTSWFNNCCTSFYYQLKIIKKTLFAEEKAPNKIIYKIRTN